MVNITVSVEFAEKLLVAYHEELKELVERRDEIIGIMQQIEQQLRPPITPPSTAFDNAMRQPLPTPYEVVVEEVKS